MALINAGYVPQGGILSAILINIKASDQPIIQDPFIADNVNNKAIISIDENPLRVLTNLRSHLDLISHWYSKLRMKLNHSKSIHS